MVDGEEHGIHQVADKNCVERAPATGAGIADATGAHAAALDVVVAVDAIAARIPARRADLADALSLGEVRVSHVQNLVFPHVKRSDLPKLWEALKALDLATPNIGLVSDIIACPGLDYCDLANARSIPVAQAIARKFADLDRQHEIGELKIKISGCINACGHHHLGHIGILGVDRKGEEYYQISLGGSGAEDASLAQTLGPGLPAGKVPDAVEAIVDTYLRDREHGERFLDTLRRLGPEPFKEAVYAEAH